MSDPKPLLDRIWNAYRSQDLDQARRLAGMASEEHPSMGGIWFALGCVLERANDLIAADRAFARASRCPEDPVGTPFRCSWARFRRLVDDAAQTLPPPLKAALGEVTLVLADYADPQQMEGQDGPELLGLFEGPTKAELDQAGEISPRIHLFRRAHEHCCGTADEFADEIRTTLLHEFGHYLGYDEEGLERLGMG